MIRHLAPILPLLLFSATARAHHGRDFLLVQDYHVPAPFTGIVYSNLEFSSQDGPDEWSVEPGAVYGLGHGLSLGVSADFGDEGDGWEYRSLSPQLQFQLTPAGANAPIRFAVIAGYQFASGTSGHAHEEDEEEDPGEEIFLPFHADHEEELSEHSHSGIHQHDADAFFARLIIESDLSEKDKLVLNLIGFSPEHGETAFGYAAGWRHSFNHDFALGVEATGDFDNDGSHEAVLAGYFSPVQGLTLKLGLGAGLTEASPDFTVRSGVVWHF